MEILETVASFLMIPSDTLHPFIFFIFFLFLFLFFFFPFLNFGFPQYASEDLCMICLSPVLFSNYSHSANTFIFILVSYFSTRYGGACSFLAWCFFLFYLSSLSRHFMFEYIIL